MPLLWPIILVSAHTALADVPRFNIAPTCSATSVATGFKRPQGACKQDENDAKTTLKKQWGTYSVAERRRCTTLTRTGGPPSYVELLTCLQMAKEAAKLPKDKLVRPLE